MKRKDFWYDLPENLIAQEPIADRSGSRLMKVDKNNGAIEHFVFSDLPRLLHPGDCLVINDSKVLPARLKGKKKDSGASIEILLLSSREADLWECIVFPGKKMREGAWLEFGGGKLHGRVENVLADGNRLVRFEYAGVFEEILDQIGEMPLPPYIKKRLEDKSRYQTVYANQEGSAAAPTAGLHFTENLLNAVEEKGVTVAKITLHVGLGTFRPVKTENVEDHLMHSESFSINSEEAAKMNGAREAGGRIIAVGTTSCRTLESCANDSSRIMPGSGSTDIFIYPGYQFQAVDGLITNFHLPESTLLMLVSAMVGREHILRAYEEAVKEQYRFFSFGDAMLIIGEKPDKKK